MANPNDGRFTWHELTSTDPARAAKFYEHLLGWTVHEVDMGPGGTYRLFKHGERQVGGGMAAPPGVPSHWLVYVGAENIDATVARIPELGGKVIVPPTTVPDMVRFAVAMDPQGAAFGVLKGLGPGADAPMPEPENGTFCWDELHTKDQAAAGKFYGSIFGWTGKVAENDPMKYWHWMHAGKDIGGMMDLMSPHAPPHWLAYLAVADVDAKTAKVRELGGKVHMEPMDIEKVGKFSVVEDPTGAHFALFRSARL
jgi:predicted enzyme related to lactoylglutathione lyase